MFALSRTDTVDLVDPIHKVSGFILSVVRNNAIRRRIQVLPLLTVLAHDNASCILQAVRTDPYSSRSSRLILPTCMCRS